MLLSPTMPLVSYEYSRVSSLPPRNATSAGSDEKRLNTQFNSRVKVRKRGVNGPLHLHKLKTQNSRAHIIIQKCTRENMPFR